MNRRHIAWLLTAAYLLVVGIWPAAVTPVALVGTGLAVAASALPAPALVAAGIAAWLKWRPAPAPTAA
ncbi:hypothetical protein [Streptomyces sp. MJP52]|uniref:hypothetical protein n=1 Tax=Streptomyces sp. MJP52 TaxID=2940555 RepID=UPI00247569F7|nr:hypothetical protein [Streptomyces sp. MJP52]MDH6224339.1 hypothetical protein [Streptomyces sp. MJP52]